MTARYLIADVFDGLATLEDGSVDLVVTSPPFLALRSYLPADDPLKSKEIGSEPTPAAFLDVMLRFTAELRRVLAPHGSICIELGDTYAGSGGGGGDYLENGWREGQQQFSGSGASMRESNAEHWRQKNRAKNDWPLNKSKTLIPELYRIALAYGINPLTGEPSPAGQWRVRNVVTWARPNPPVGALGDKWRPATSDVVVACTSAKRYWDDLATRKPYTAGTLKQYRADADDPLGTQRATSGRGPKSAAGHGYTRDDYLLTHSGAPLLDYWEIPLDGGEPTRYGPKEKPAKVNNDKRMYTDPVARNDGGEGVERYTSQHESGAPLLDYWEIPPGGYTGSHYAVFPPELVVPLVKAMCPERVCRECGEPSRRIHENFGRQRFKRPPKPEVFGGWMRDAMSNAEVSIDALAAHLGVTDRMILFYRGEPHEAQLPSVERWLAICEMVPFPDVVLDAMELVDAEYETVDRGNRQIKERLSGGAARGDKPKVVATGWTDCGHNNYRPGLVLDPFAGSGTTLLVATGHGHDAIGIDLDARNAELALQRVGPFLLTVEELETTIGDNQ